MKTSALGTGGQDAKGTKDIGLQVGSSTKFPGQGDIVENQRIKGNDTSKTEEERIVRPRSGGCGSWKVRVFTCWWTCDPG